MILKRVETSLTHSQIIICDIALLALLSVITVIREVVLILFKQNGLGKLKKKNSEIALWEMQSPGSTHSSNSQIFPMTFPT